MKFYIPNIDDARQAEEVLRDIKTYAEDATGWLVSEHRVYAVEYLDGNEAAHACVGGSIFDEMIECILETDLVLMLCTIVDGLRLGPPVMIDKRNVLSIDWFEGHSPVRFAERSIDPGTIPAGTVTFLFTDIEGSTKLWEENPEAMRVALQRHDELIERAIERNYGHVFKTVGDSYCCSFHTAPEAAQAALDAQLYLQAESWPTNSDIKVRMALHTGVAESRGGDYFGQPLNRVARLLSTAHGGQILLSESASDLCRDYLPSAADLRSLGEHRLKDLGRPEVIHQLVHPEIESVFPPLRSVRLENQTSLPAHVNSPIAA